MIVSAVIGIIFFSYVGYVVGLSSYCRQISSLKLVKEFVWIIPIIIILFPFTVLFSPGIDHRMFKLQKFFHIPEKGLAFIIIFEKMLLQEEEKKSEASDAITIDIRKREIIFPGISKFFLIGREALYYYSKSPAT